VAFAEIFKCPVRAVAIRVPVLQSFLTGNYENQGVFCGGDDATLLLSTKFCMDISLPL
jgi:hypothetical protein